MFNLIKVLDFASQNEHNPYIDALGANIKEKKGQKIDLKYKGIL